MAVPRLEKITLNMGVGEAKTNAKALDEAAEQLALIAGQRPRDHARQGSIAGFRLREGMPIGCKVTLRGERMYEFLDRLLAIALPRIRDFRGINPNASTATATSRWACASRSSSPRSTPTTSTRCAA